ncbi:hypothetical protein ACFX13_001648 [Malus domestica]
MVLKSKNLTLLPLILYAISLIILHLKSSRSRRTVEERGRSRSCSLISLSMIFSSKKRRVVFIIISCLISVSVNFSTFLVIGKTSPVTYQVLGHLKTCLVLAFGYILLHDPFDWRNILGILVALAGMVLYSYFCTREGQKKAAEEATQPPQAGEGESDPLMGVENGSGVGTDSAPQIAPVWKLNKDLHA